MRILKNCTLSTEWLGIYSRIPVKHYIVYAQDIKELIGFRQTQTRSLIGHTHYIELGTFMDMLYEGYQEAYDILACNDEGVEEDFIGRILIINNLIENKTLITNLVTESEEIFKKLSQKLANFEILSYICVMKLQLAINIMENGTYEPISRLQLQNILDSKISFVSLKKEYTRLLRKAKKLLESCEFGAGIDREFANEAMLKLRNYE